MTNFQEVNLGIEGFDNLNGIILGEDDELQAA